MLPVSTCKMPYELRIQRIDVAHTMKEMFEKQGALFGTDRDFCVQAAEPTARALAGSTAAPPPLAVLPASPAASQGAASPPPWAGAELELSPAHSASSGGMREEDWEMIVARQHRRNKGRAPAAGGQGFEMINGRRTFNKDEVETAAPQEELLLDTTLVSGEPVSSPGTLPRVGLVEPYISLAVCSLGKPCAVVTTGPLAIVKVSSAVLFGSL